MAPKRASHHAHDGMATCSFPSFSFLRIRTRRLVLLLVMLFILTFESNFATSFQTLCRPRSSSRASAAFCFQRANPIPKSHANLKFTTRKRICTKIYASVPKDDAPKQSVSTAERNLGILVLCSVPLAWGTFEPVVRYVYTIKPAVPGFVFSVCYYVVAAVALSTLAAFSMSPKGDSEASKSKGSSFLPILGGMELGTYLFLGNGLQVLGLKTVPSDRAAFLLQLTTIFVPLVQAIIAGNLEAIPLKTWGACFLALTGVAVMGLDGIESADGDSLSTLVSSFSSLTLGDFMIVLAALAYTFHCIRLERYAKETSAVKLAASKASTETAWSLALVLGLMSFASNNSGDQNGIFGYAVEQGAEISTYLSTMSDEIAFHSLSLETLVPALAAVLWTGLVTCGYTIYAQSFGQSRVNPTDANLIYTIQPIFTALFAWGLLGETLGPAGYIGGALIGSAVYTVARSDNEINVNNDANMNEDDKDMLGAVNEAHPDSSRLT